MADLSAASTDSCLLQLLQEEFACTSSVAAKAYMYDEASACNFNVQNGRKEKFSEVGCERARSGSY